MKNKKLLREKKRLKELCKCGHRRGEHTYHKGSFCTRVMSCNCKMFEPTGKYENEKQN